MPSLWCAPHKIMAFGRGESRMTLPLRLRKALVLSSPLIWALLFIFVPYMILFVFSLWEL